MVDKLHAFLCSKPWRDLSYRLKVERGGKCNRCGNILEDFSLLIGHHQTELTEDNVDNPAIALNPEKIEVICLNCHNHEHRRFGNKQQVYIVWGSPLSGKNTMVRELMQYGDIVLDVDAIWQAISGQPEYVKPGPVRFNVFKLRDEMLDQIKTRYGQWYDAYIIGGYPDKYERERVAQSLGAATIYCESTKDECYQRRQASGKPAQWDDYITEWWERYGEH